MTNPTLEKGLQKAKKITKWTLGIFLLLAILFGAYFFFGSYSDGYRVGTVMKVSKKGYIFKTWEGQLNVGGLQSDATADMATTVWEFSVRDKNVLKDLETAVDKGHKAKLFYEEKFFKFSLFGDTKYFVTKVEQVE